MIIHPQLSAVLDASDALVEVAALAARTARKLVRQRRRGAFRVRKPGADAPMWAALSILVRAELKPAGAKARLARYLGVPRQRLHDYLKARSRVPDAEIGLRLLHWFVTKRRGRDLST